jgi:hypothetical protein
MLVPISALSHDCALSVCDTSWCMEWSIWAGRWGVQGGEGVEDGRQQLYPSRRQLQKVEGNQGKRKMGAVLIADKINNKRLDLTTG